MRVGFREYRDSADTHALAGLDDAAGNFAAIGDENFVEHRLAFYHPTRFAFIKKGAHTFFPLCAGAYLRNALRGVGDYSGVDSLIADRIDQKLALGNRLRAAEQQRCDDVRNLVVHRIVIRCKFM